MNDTNAISLPEPSALRPQGWGAEVEVISSDLTEEQRALVIQVKQLSAVVHMAGFERAKRLRLLRDSFPIGGNNNQSARMGWADFLRREFDTNVQDVSREISAIEAADDFLDETRSGPAHRGIFDQIGSSHLNEIGRGSTPAIRRKVWDMLLDGKLNLNKRAIRAEIKDLNGKKGTSLEGVKKPDSRPKATKSDLPTPPKSGAKVKVMSKATYGYLPDQKDQLKYLQGKPKANEWFEEELTALLRSASQRGAGKTTVIKALARSLHSQMKLLADRYYGAWDHDSGYPAYMTLWQSIWTEEHNFTLGDEFNAIRADISGANRFYEIAIDHTFTTNLEVTE